MRLEVVLMPDTITMVVVGVVEVSWSEESLFLVRLSVSFSLHYYLNEILASGCAYATRLKNTYIIYTDTYNIYTIK